MRTLILLLGLLVALPAAGDPNAELVSRAFASISKDFEDDWAYTEISTEEEQTFTGRYDPRLEPAWTLISVDGREPSEPEREEYAVRKVRDKRGGGEDDDGENMIRPGTLELLEETDTYWLFAFQPLDEDEEDDAARKFMKHVDGTLKIIKDGHYVEYMDLRNKKAIRPIIGVKISAFNTRLTFGPATEGGPIVPKSIDVRVKGGAFLAVKFDTSERVRFTAWEYAGE
ncbi:MAG: hypothetical protein QNJ00_04930 [Woeseiaceae bacterium]|nr:hypothetical protein [Woeseiaceae bacterium]